MAYGGYAPGCPDAGTVVDSTSANLMQSSKDSTSWRRCSKANWRPGLGGYATASTTSWPNLIVWMGKFKARTAMHIGPGGTIGRQLRRSRRHHVRVQWRGPFDRDIRRPATRVRGGWGMDQGTCRTGRPTPRNRRLRPFVRRAAPRAQCRQADRSARRRTQR
jgi:hypothetical protein